MDIDLRENLPIPRIRSTAAPGVSMSSYTILLDGWRIERLHLYRPLIVVTAVGSGADATSIARTVASLREPGGYDGAVHVITDLPAARLASVVPDVASGRVTVQYVVQATGGAVGWSRFGILDEPSADSFQPILLLDTTVTGNGTLAPILADLVTLDRIAATVERSASSQHPASAGTGLIARAGLSPRYPTALNAGVIGIPNLREHGPTLELVRAILVNVAAASNDPGLVGETLSYVSYTGIPFDTETVGRFVHARGNGSAEQPSLVLSAHVATAQPDESAPLSCPAL